MTFSSAPIYIRKRRRSKDENSGERDAETQQRRTQCEEEAEMASAAQPQPVLYPSHHPCASSGTNHVGNTVTEHQIISILKEKVKKIPNSSRSYSGQINLNTSWRKVSPRKHAREAEWVQPRARNNVEKSSWNVNFLLYSSNVLLRRD